MADMSMLEKLMAKKGEAKLDPEYKKAKMGVLTSLHGEMGKLMGDDVKGLKKVTVAAPDADGLAKGLEKAEDLVGEGTPQVCEECGEVHGDEKDHTMDEKLAEEKAPEEMSAEELDAKIQELEMLKAKKAEKQVRI